MQQKGIQLSLFTKYDDSFASALRKLVETKKQVSAKQKSVTESEKVLAQKQMQLEATIQYENTNRFSPEYDADDEDSADSLENSISSLIKDIQKDKDKIVQLKKEIAHLTINVRYLNKKIRDSRKNQR